MYYYGLYFFVVTGLITLLAHELGHYIGYRLFGFNPSIEVQGINLMIGENVVGKMRGWQVAVVSVMGMGAGFIPLHFAIGLMPSVLYGILILLYMAGLYFDVKVFLKAFDCFDEYYRG